MEKMFFIVLLLFPIVYSCNRSTESERNSEKGKFFNVDIERDINATKQLKISSISDSVEYIALETNPDCLLAEIRNITIEGNHIIILSEGANKEIYVFNRSGNFVNKVGSKGQGPEEYYDVVDYVIHNNEVFIVDYRSRLAKYKITGEFVQYIRLPKGVLLK